MRGGNRIDLTGQRFGKLLVTDFSHYSESRTNRVMWLCACECGNAVTASTKNLRHDGKTSCGCVPARPGRQEWNGRKYSLSELAAIAGVDKGTIAGRLKRGMTVEEAISLKWPAFTDAPARGETRCSLLTAEMLREILHYDPETGVFTRRVAGGGLKVGDVAGWSQKGYVTLSVWGFRVQAHRAAWLYVYGEWPGETVDHIDGNPSNNRISNLRSVPVAVNNQNHREPRSNNKSGFLGVSRDRTPGKWQASIRVNNKSIALGRYDTPEAAHAAYLTAKRRLHEGCTI